MNQRTRSFGATAGDGRDPADRASIRRNNLGMILRYLRDQGARSRTVLAQETGLPKATISSFIAELAELGLVREGDFERDARSVGRPRQSVELDGRGVCGVGVEIDADHVSVIAIDLRGRDLFERRVPVDVLGLGAEGALDAVAALLREVLAALASRNVRAVGITVAMPGSTDAATGSSLVSANLGWHDVGITTGLRARLGGQAPPLGIGNDARLGGIAEYLAISHTGVRNLLYITGDIGIGGGIMADGLELLGHNGNAGEIGHMPMNPEPVACACGRRGCWETMVGLGVLLSRAADPDDPVHDPRTDREQRLAEIRRRARQGDARTLEALERTAADLGRGVALLVDVLSPQTVVLGGYFAYLGEFLLEPVQHTVDERVLYPGAGGSTVGLAVHGFTSALRGGALFALEAVFQDPGGRAS
ncbi:ROK family protein [Streptomyces sp. NPDC091272]|uniref:ROK family protein n=1 Tax=Streptomyces sp. NPDC091272 TaxID=3365981 RepID=UPI00382ACF5F